MPRSDIFHNAIACSRLKVRNIPPAFCGPTGGGRSSYEEVNQICEPQLRVADSTPSAFDAATMKL